MRPGQRVRAVGIQMGAQDRRPRRLRRSRRQTQGGARRVEARRPEGRAAHRGRGRDRAVRRPGSRPGAGVRLQPSDGRARPGVQRFRRGVQPAGRELRPRARRRSHRAGGARRGAAAGAAPGLDPHLAPARDRYPRGQLPAVERARGVDGMRSGDAVDRRQAGEPVQAQGPRRRWRSLRVPDHGPVAAVRLQRRRGSMRGARVPFPEGDAGERAAHPRRVCLAARRRRRLLRGGGHEGDGAGLRQGSSRGRVATAAAAHRGGGGRGGCHRRRGGGGGGGAGRDAGGQARRETRIPRASGPGRRAGCGAGGAGADDGGGAGGRRRRELGGAG
mmetsp:Transcript_10812/g.45009  ORF Transcript_10812/g.45009 Transcript_10812/m.45009 type:complete len:331 (+) Transcript_10812:497-1489(+)